ERAEGHRRGVDRDRHHGGAVAGGRVPGGVRGQRAQGGDVARFAVGGGEFTWVDAPARGVVQLSVHRGVFLALPSLGEAFGGFLAGRAGGAGNGAEDEGDEG